MKKILVTGGTVFVSRYIAEYYVKNGCDVYVLNRNSKEQSDSVNLIQADRHNLGETLRDFNFDVVIDTAYNCNDVEMLLDALGDYKDYVLISSSAVYPEYSEQPFKEDSLFGVNKYWGKYGTDKVEAEAALLKRNPNAYVLRPPYLYGQMNNVYREAFVFDCALANRKFYLPKDGKMKLQFFHINDLCRFIDVLLKKRPDQRIFNVGNKDTVTIQKWVELCYQATGKQAEFVNVYDDIEQRNYFSFYNYEYCLDVSKQYDLMPEVKPLYQGLKESFDWYKNNTDKVNKKPYIDYIENELEVTRTREQTVTICGSMKFEKEMQRIAFLLEAKHNMNVLQCVYNVDDLDITPTEQVALENAHYRKIELSDAIYVVDIQGYIGNQVSKEIAFAKNKGKKVIFHSEYSREK